MRHLLTLALVIVVGGMEFQTDQYGAYHMVPEGKCRLMRYGGTKDIYAMSGECVPCTVGLNLVVYVCPEKPKKKGGKR